MAKPCQGKAVRAEELDAIVWQDIKRFAEDPDPVLAELEAKLQEEPEKTLVLDREIEELDSDSTTKHSERERVITL